MIKSTINLPVLHNSSCKYAMPTMEYRLNSIAIKWQYQNISWSCQGNWCTYECIYDKDDFNFNKAINDLNEFVKDNI